MQTSHDPRGRRLLVPKDFGNRPVCLLDLLLHEVRLRGEIEFYRSSFAGFLQNLLILERLLPRQAMERVSISFSFHDARFNTEPPRLYHTTLSSRMRVNQPTVRAPVSLLPLI